MRDRQISDYQEDMLKDQQREELVEMIWSYTLALEQYVVNLRRRVNTMAAEQGLLLPYPDLESDFRIRFFCDYPAYVEFREVLDAEDTDLVLPE
jgi:hypothetical protein